MNIDISPHAGRQIIDGRPFVHIVLYAVTGMDPVLWEDRYAPEPIRRPGAATAVTS